VAGRNDHVVGAGREMEAAVVVLPECIASEVPAVPDVVPLPLVGEIAAAGRAANREPADLAARLFVHGFVDDLGLVSGDWPARTRRRGAAGTVGNEDVHQLGGAEAV